MAKDELGWRTLPHATSNQDEGGGDGRHKNYRAGPISSLIKQDGTSGRAR